MYYYVYDEFVQNRKYEKDLFQIENRLTDLDISGKIGRLALFKDACELVKDEIRRGAETVILVGNDETVHKIKKIMPEAKATFGILPIGEENQSFAKISGMPSGLAACDVISARIVRPMDIGKVNDRCFLSRVMIPDTRVSIRCEGAYSIAPAEKGDIEIRNWGLMENKQYLPANPEDGKLDVIVHAKIGKKEEESTTLRLQYVDIRTKQQIPLYLDGERINGSSFKIKIAPKKLRWIVGKERLF